MKRLCLKSYLASSKEALASVFTRRQSGLLFRENFCCWMGNYSNQIDSCKVILSKPLIFVNTQFCQGSKIQVKGIPDIARHTYVRVTQCEDEDNFAYPRGLICAADTGE